jgi:tetratricopeptide (TPR) repeat protein
MSTRFCSQCGAKLLSDARFCAECGQAIGSAPSAKRPKLALERWAPALVVGVIVVVAGATIIVGARSAPPPNIPPPRAAADKPAADKPAGEMPQGHPPVEVPDDVRQVIAKLAEAAKSKPEDIDTWLQLGFVQYRAGQVDPAYLADANATYTHIVERQPENLDALRALGNIAFDRSDPTRAMDFYKRYLKVKPDDLSVQTDLGTMLLSSDQVPAALKAYQDVLAVDPNFFQAQFNLAIAYRAAGDDDKAMEALGKAREIAKDDATRDRVDALLARLKDAPAAGAPAGAPAAEPPQAVAGNMRGDVEGIFRSHPIVGPKLDRIDWQDDEHVRVMLRDFPMDGMPPMVRTKFTDRIRNGVRDNKTKYRRSTTLTIELVDVASGRVMETVTE